MAFITFGTRYLFTHPSLPIRLGPKVAKFLSYSAPAVLTRYLGANNFCSTRAVKSFDN